MKLSARQLGQLDAMLIMLYGVESGNAEEYDQIRDEIVEWMEGQIERATSAGSPRPTCP
jgi:hypothetical protein